MVKVSAQTNSCEPHSEGTPDNATQETQDTQTTTTSESTVPNAATEDNPNDPSTLAARILQLSADFETKMPSRPKKPALKKPDKTPLEMPDVLTAEPANDWTPRLRRRRSSRPLPVQYGPSFKALAFSTVVLALAGSGAIALGLPELIADNGPDVIQVDTQTITAVPKQDFTRAVSTDPSATTGPVSPKTLTKTQDRIHQAFEETDLIPGTPTNELAKRAVASLDQSTSARDLVWDAPTNPSQRKSGATDETTTVREMSAISTTDPGAQALPTFEPRQAAGTPLLPSLAVNDTTGTITASVNLRETGTRNGKIIGIVPEGSEVSFSDCGKWWCEVVHDGKTGFVGQKFVDR